MYIIYIKHKRKPLHCLKKMLIFATFRRETMLDSKILFFATLRKETIALPGKILISKKNLKCYF